MKEKLEEQNVKPANLLSLTKHDADGNLYKRAPDIDNQITEALQLDKSDLIERLSIRDANVEGYFKEECLVYLIRHFKREGIHSLENEVMSHLAKRIASYTHNKISKPLDRRYHDEAFQDVIVEVTCRLTDIETDKQDYAQCRFGHWLKRIVLNTIRPYFKRQTQDRDTNSLDQRKEADDSAIADKNSPSPYDEMLRKEARGALNILEPHERTAFELRYYAGWEIENQDPKVMTISRYLKKTPKTIYNWLRNAEAKLKEWRGGAK
jgi:RNA polymerase sigma factor (sigma-70 family)